jgi:hypothetical protein
MLHIQRVKVTLLDMIYLHVHPLNGIFLKWNLLILKAIHEIDGYIVARFQLRGSSNIQS